jgi:hypothetical protein
VVLRAVQIKGIFVQATGEVFQEKTTSLFLTEYSIKSHSKVFLLYSLFAEFTK